MPTRSVDFEVVRSIGAALARIKRTALKELLNDARDLVSEESR
jgi:hypothetical protein